MSARYEALAAKAKAMYGRRMRRGELQQLAQLDSVQQVMDELSQQPSWGEGMRRLSRQGLVTRGRLEDALRDQLRQEGMRLMAFIPHEDWALMDFPLLRAEVDQILAALSRLHASLYREMEELPWGYISRVKVDLAGLHHCQDFNGLVEATRGSIFHDALSRLADGEKLPDYGVAEALLWSVYYRHILRLIARRYEGDTRRLLEQSVGGQVDMLNIMHILRMKQFFAREDNYLPVLLPYHYRLRQDRVRAMCAAAGPQEVLQLLEGTPYAETFRGAAPEQLQDRYSMALYQLSRRQLRMGKPSVYTAVAYLNLRELELRAVVSAVETVKYHQSLDPALLYYFDP